MTTDERQVAVNDRAVREAAERLTATGWVGDAYRFVESLLLNAVASGWRRIEPVPPPAGRGSSDDKRRRLIEATTRQLAERKRERHAAPSRVRRGNENEEQ